MVGYLSGSDSGRGLSDLHVRVYLWSALDVHLREVSGGDSGRGFSGGDSGR